MRMNPQRGIPASKWLARITPEKLETALHLNSDEPRADFLATCLAGKNFPDTLSLANAIRQSLAPLIGDPEEIEKTIRRVFQAIRIAVNEEFIALDTFLRLFPTCLKPGGRIAILTFHSGEDRRVKQTFKILHRAGLLSEISSSPITPTPQERHQNPRSTSAKLRFATLATELDEKQSSTQSFCIPSKLKALNEGVIETGGRPDHPPQESIAWSVERRRRS
jgi:16S rRNA (cytosine1402-N4)-methyltransferase